MSERDLAHPPPLGSTRPERHGDADHADTVTIRTADPDGPERDWGTAMLKGLRGRCPRCGKGRLFTGFLRVKDHCPNCGEALHHHRADDAPPYVVMLIVGHVVVGVMLWLEVVHAPPMWVHAALFLPLTILMSLALLPPVKGALVALQWANRMHGFDPEGEHGQ